MPMMFTPRAVAIARAARSSRSNSLAVISSAPRRLPAGVTSRHTASGMSMCPTIVCSKSSAPIRAHASRGGGLRTIIRFRLSLRGLDFRLCICDREGKSRHSSRVQGVEKV